MQKGGYTKFCNSNQFLFYAFTENTDPISINDNAQATLNKEANVSLDLSEEREIDSREMETPTRNGSSPDVSKLVQFCI